MKSAKPERRATASDVMAAMAKRYAAPSWALLEQVGNGTGWAANRWADAIALSLWPSRGLDLHGFEIKVARNDWLRELKAPFKADEIAGYCDFWWIVEGAPGVVDMAVDPFPAPWGLMQLSGKSLRVVKDAQRNPSVATMERSMLAAIFRRATERMMPKDAFQAAVDSARIEGEEYGKYCAMGEGAESRVASRLEALQRQVQEFEQASGVRLTEYSAGAQGRAFKLAMELGEYGIQSRLRSIRDSLVAAKKAIDTTLASDPKVAGTGVA